MRKNTFCIPSCFLPILLLLSLASPSFAQPGQALREQIKIETGAHHQVRINFPVKDTLANLLVRINDIHGVTIFLDDRYEFTGSYSATVDMKGQGGGGYALEVIGDKERINKTFELK